MNHLSLPLSNNMKLPHVILSYIFDIHKPMSEICPSNKSSLANIYLLILNGDNATKSSEDNTSNTYIKINLIVGISTLVLNLIIIIGYIWGALDNPAYVFFIITLVYGVLSLILYILHRKSLPNRSILYVLLFLILTSLYLAMIAVIYFPFKPVTFYLPNPRV